MNSREQISPLLLSVVQDNPTIKFPIESIRKELLSMLLHQIEFEYFTIQCYKNLKRDFGFVYAHVFLTTLEIKMNLKEVDVTMLPELEYESSLEEFIVTLENLYISRIEKLSSDGEMISAMV